MCLSVLPLVVAVASFENNPGLSAPPPTNRGALNTDALPDCAELHTCTYSLELPGPPDGNHDGDAELRDISCSLHWLSATARETNIIDAAAFVGDYLGCQPVIKDKGLNGYTSTWEFYGGLRLLDNEKRPEMGVHMIADGETCETLGLEKLSYIYQALQMTASRCDVAADHCDFSPETLRDYWLADEIRTRCKPADSKRYVVRPGMEDIRTHEWWDSSTGQTFYMGSRSSTQFARCYTMRGYTRFEMELKKERAAQVMELLCDSPDSLPQTTLSVIRQFVDFVELDDSNRARCSLKTFWAEFIAGFDRATIAIKPRPERTVGRIVDWIEGQVARSLALYEMVKGGRDSFDDVRRELRKLGLERLTSHDHALIEAVGGWNTGDSPFSMYPIPKRSQPLNESFFAQNKRLSFSG